MPIIDNQTVGYQKNSKACKLRVALYLQFRLKIEIKEHTLYPTCCTLVNQKNQIGLWEKRRNKISIRSWWSNRTKAWKSKRKESL
jgi:hypothetical protein